MANSESTEMYLETVLLLEREHGHAHIAEIATHLGVSKPSVSRAMGKLADRGLVIKDSYGPVTLTEEGASLGRRIYESHKLITEYLMHSLGLNQNDAADNACKIEHVISEPMREAIVEYLRTEHRR